MMRLFICPECGWMRTVSRRASVECFKCNGVMMQPVKLEYTQYVKMSEQERMIMQTVGCISIGKRANRIQIPMQRNLCGDFLC